MPNDIYNLYFVESIEKKNVERFWGDFEVPLPLKVWSPSPYITIFYHLLSRLFRYYGKRYCFWNTLKFPRLLHHFQRLEETNRMADSNYAKLKVESDRLEVHAKRSCNWWIWGTVIFVSVVFLQMIIFIKFFPKGSWWHVWG